MQHDAFDAIGLNGASRAVRVVREDIPVVLALPSFATLWSRLCGSTAPAHDTLLVFGSVRLAAGDTVSRASLVGTGEWIELSGKGKSLADIGQRRLRREASVDTSGSYALCGLPMGVPLTLAFAASANDSLRRVAITMAPTTERVARQDIVLPSGGAARAALGVLRGVVRNARGAGIAGASVTVGEFEGVRSDDSGRYVLRGIPEGTHQLEVMAIGYQVASRPVVIDATSPAVIDVSLSAVTRLEAIKVEATVLAERTRAIEERIRAGFGYHRDSTVMRDFPGVPEVLDSIPGVRMRRVGTRVVVSGPCPNWDIRIDGIPGDTDDLRALDPRDVAMMEVYTRNPPSELMTGRRGCPLLVWTKRGLGRQH
ncbi:MAG: carboxypeptidase-like regulatory domain-containing protein [Gemmatimonadaceae bacterium]|nr:carboxypeptidase-like regulatory domain-containing protein [Gemmatimonadaceae bacterium]